MERAGRVVRKLNVTSEEQLAQAAWAQAVGKKIASHTGNISLIRDRLIVEVEDAVWQRQLFTLRRQILARIEQVMGSNLIQELELRIAIPRRAPQREERISTDDADGIKDPVLRNLYKASRKRAIA
ncbi:MAG: DciA family protein [Bryobacteraceae bacterium]